MSLDLPPGHSWSLSAPLPVRQRIRSSLDSEPAFSSYHPPLPPITPPKSCRPSTGHYRIARKPVSAIDHLNLSFPEPDPEHPFAPLWSLRNPGIADSSSSIELQGCGLERDNLRLFELANSAANEFEDEAWNSWMNPSFPSSPDSEYSEVHRSPTRAFQASPPIAYPSKTKRPHTSEGNETRGNTFSFPFFVSSSATFVSAPPPPPSAYDHGSLPTLRISRSTPNTLQGESSTAKLRTVTSYDTLPPAPFRSRSYNIPPLYFDAVDLSPSLQSLSRGSFFESSISSDPAYAANILLQPSQSVPAVINHESDPAHVQNPEQTVFKDGDGPVPFDEHAMPTLEQLNSSQSLDVISESGIRVRFGDLWKGQRTVVIFIRHFWCPLCQDYMFSISRNVSPAVLEQAKVRLIIISNGSFEMIRSYRKIFRTPFEVYTDPTHKVYEAMGMTLRTLEKGHEEDRGGYVRHETMSGIGMVVVNALKVGMPFWVKGGEIDQLGGEFVLGPGLQCTFAHRMTTTRSHVSILSVLKHANVDMVTPLKYEQTLYVGPTSVRMMTAEEERKWKIERQAHLIDIKDRKKTRRGGSQFCIDSVMSIDTSSNRPPSVAGTSISAHSRTGSFQSAVDFNTSSSRRSTVSLSHLSIEEAPRDSDTNASHRPRSSTVSCDASDFRSCSSQLTHRSHSTQRKSESSQRTVEESEYTTLRPMVQNLEIYSQSACSSDLCFAPVSQVARMPCRDLREPKSKRVPTPMSTTTVDVRGRSAPKKSNLDREDKFFSGAEFFMHW